VSLPPLSEADRAALSSFLAASVHVLSGDGGKSVRLFLSVLDRDELEELAARTVCWLARTGDATVVGLRRQLLELEAMA
jgi:hypothetical protein